MLFTYKLRWVLRCPPHVCLCLDLYYTYSGKCILFYMLSYKNVCAYQKIIIRNIFVLPYVVSTIRLRLYLSNVYDANLNFYIAHKLFYRGRTVVFTNVTCIDVFVYRVFMYTAFYLSVIHS